MFKKMDEIIEYATSKGKKRIAVVSPESENVLEGLKISNDIAYPILFGNKSKLDALLVKVGIDAEVVHADTQIEASYAAIQWIREKKADFLMKGKISTPDFLKTVLDKDRGLRTGRILSHIAVQEIPGYNRLVFVTDAGMNIRPNLSEKVDILKNCLGIMKNMGYKDIKVAILASIEQVSQKMQETIDAAVLSKMGDRGVFGNGVVVDGPLGFDMVADEEAAKMKGVRTSVAGKSDVWLVPDVASGNILSKALIYFAKSKIGGIVAGARAPIILLSRADTPMRKFYSIATGIAALG